MVLRLLTLLIAVVSVVAGAFAASIRPAGAHAAVAAPQFMEQTPLSIPLDCVGGTSVWRIGIVNPGPATRVEVHVAGAVGQTLAVRSPARLQLAPGGTAWVDLVPGSRPRAGTGQLLLISPAGIDRRQVSVTLPFLRRHLGWVVAGGVAAVAALVCGVVLWMRRRARRKAREEILDDTPAAGTDHFTHTDEPTEHDRLHRGRYAAGLARLAAHATPPLVIGVLGEWGTGKTSLLKQIRTLIDGYDHCVHVWFDPWRHQHDANPVLPLLHTIVTGLGLERKENLRQKLGVISDVLGSLVLTSTLKVSVADVRKSFEVYDEQNFRVRSEHARLDGHLRTLIARALEARGKSRLIVFVDDLDRCHADQIVALLETLKLHFNRDNCVFFLGVAKAPLDAAVQRRYQDQPVGDYLDKIVQFPFEMPRLSGEALQAYIDGLLTDDIRQAGELLRIGLRPNPRTIKRFVNVLILQDSLAKGHDDLRDYDVSILAAVLLIRHGDPEFYDRLTEDPTLLRRIVEDLDTAAEDEPLTWDPLPLKLVRGFPGGRERIPGDVSSYIDLVKSSPVVPQSDAVAETPEEGQAADDSSVTALGLTTQRADFTQLRGRVHRYVSALAADEEDLFDPLVRFSRDGDRVTATPEEILAREGAGLYIHGEPGSGKTVLAVRLTRRLLARPDVVPVFLPVSALSDSRDPELRLTHAIRREYQMSLVETWPLVQSRSLVYVLDGLHELDSGTKAVRFLEDVSRHCALTGVRLVVTDRGGTSREPVSARLGLETMEVLGVPEEDGRRRLEELLAARHVPFDRLGALPSALLTSPGFLSVLAARPSWIADLPRSPTDFLPWYADRARTRLEVTAVERRQVVRALRKLAIHAEDEDLTGFSSEAAPVREIFRDCGIVGMQVSEALQAMVEVGVLCATDPETFQFAHPLLRDHLAR